MKIESVVTNLDQVRISEDSIETRGRSKFRRKTELQGYN